MRPSTLPAAFLIILFSEIELIFPNKHFSQLFFSFPYLSFLFWFVAQERGWDIYCTRKKSFEFKCNVQKLKPQKVVAILRVNETSRRFVGVQIYDGIIEHKRLHTAAHQDLNQTGFQTLISAHLSLWNRVRMHTVLFSAIFNQTSTFSCVRVYFSSLQRDNTATRILFSFFFHF